MTHFLLLRPHRTLLLLCLAALVLRLFLLFAFVRFPGIADSNHYYNMGARLNAGYGFTIDYLWQYNRPPETIDHPEDHWMPGAAVLAAAGMRLTDAPPGTSQSAQMAILPFALIGSMLPALAYWAARQFGLGVGAALFSAAMAAVLPEFVLNSVRTDTAIPAAFCVSASILLLNHGLRSGRASAFMGSGALGGIAYLIRTDAALLLPMLVVFVVVLRFARRNTPGVEYRFRWRAVLLMPVVMIAVITPWLIRNVQTFGSPGSPETDDMFFFTSHDDHYAFGRHFTLETMLAAQSPAQIVGKRAFEMAAGAKMTITTLDLFAPMVIGGAILIFAARRMPASGAQSTVDWRILAPTIILLFGAYIAYTVFIPYKAQAGSFKKAWLMVLPLLLPLAAFALERIITNEPVRAGAMAILLALVGINAVELVRADAGQANDYVATLERVAGMADTLPDTNGDGEIRLMTQDPYVVRYVGLRAAMFPSEPLEIVYTVARLYGIDYLLMPAARPALDPLYLGAIIDPRFVYADALPGTPYQFFRVAPPENGSTP